MVSTSPPTIKDLHEKLDASKDYELFRRTLRRLEQGNTRTMLRLAREAGLINGPEHREPGEGDMGEISPA